MILNRTSDLPPERFADLGTDFRLSLTSLIESDEQVPLPSRSFAIIPFGRMISHPAPPLQPIIRTALHHFVQRLIIGGKNRPQLTHHHHHQISNNTTANENKR